MFPSFNVNALAKLLIDITKACPPRRLTKRDLTMDVVANFALLRFEASEYTAGRAGRITVRWLKEQADKEDPTMLHCRIPPKASLVLSLLILLGVGYIFEEQADASSGNCTLKSVTGEFGATFTGAITAGPFAGPYAAVASLPVVRLAITTLPVSAPTTASRCTFCIPRPVAWLSSAEPA